MKDYQPTKKYFQKVFLPLQYRTSVRYKQRGKLHAAFCQIIWKIQSKQEQSMIVIPPMVHIVYCNSCIINWGGNGRLYTYGGIIVLMRYFQDLLTESIRKANTSIYYFMFNTSIIIIIVYDLYLKKDDILVDICFY